MHKVRLTVGGDKLTFDGLVSVPTSDLKTSKIHWNSVILNLGVKYIMVNVKNFYLKKPTAEHEYYKIDFSLILQDVIYKYNLIDRKINSFLYVRVDKGMHGIFQAGIITHTALKEYLLLIVYKPTPITSEFWLQNKNVIMFTIFVGNFGIRH